MKRLGLRREQRFRYYDPDSDFLLLATKRGIPPKIVWLENCNDKRFEVEGVIRRNALRTAETRTVITACAYPSFALDFSWRE
jgi:hypothetical protein